MTAPDPAAARRDAEEALRPVSDDEAQEILSRFIASHFRKHDREHARFRIPADPEHDDDLRMSQYIRETRALRALLAAEQGAPTPLHFVCTDFPGPGNECVFVECETGDGHSINAGEWVRRPDGLVALVVSALLPANPCPVCKRPVAEHRHHASCSCQFCCNRPVASDGDGRDGCTPGPFEE